MWDHWIMIRYLWYTPPLCSLSWSKFAVYGHHVSSTDSDRPNDTRRIQRNSLFIPEFLNFAYRSRMCPISKEASKCPDGIRRHSLSWEWEIPRCAMMNVIMFKASLRFWNIQTHISFNTLKDVQDNTEITSRAGLLKVCVCYDMLNVETLGPSNTSLPITNIMAPCWWRHHRLKQGWNLWQICPLHDSQWVALSHSCSCLSPFLGLVFHLIPLSFAFPQNASVTNHSQPQYTEMIYLDRSSSLIRSFLSLLIWSVGHSRAQNLTIATP